MKAYVGCTEVIELSSGTAVRITLERDDCIGAPWKEYDFHGEVSDWVRRDKRPGELVLSEDRGSKRYYDFAGTVAVARRDGWDAAPYGGTKGERAHRAAMADYERLRAWCNDDWCYAVAHVELLRDGKSVADEYLGGIESDYATDSVREMIDQILADDTHETGEVAYWAARGVVTVEVSL
tara:strand:- start:1136 stop:1675 length:540 start_codon:yes stop_codon:yes gene_type:complete